MQNKLILSFLCILSLAFIAGCGGGGGGSNDLPVQTIQWQPDGNGFVQFYTNDKNNAFKSFFYYSTNSAGLTSYKIELKKISGISTMGYGLVYNYIDSSNYSCALIDTTGWYSIQKVVSNISSAIVDWTQNSNLKTGFGEVNTISIVTSGTTGTTRTSSVEFNNVGIPDTIDTPTGKYGFIAITGKVVKDDSDDPLENFPNVPEDMRFRDDSETLNSQSLKLQSSALSSYQSFQSGQGINNLKTAH